MTTRRALFRMLAGGFVALAGGKALGRTVSSIAPASVSNDIFEYQRHLAKEAERIAGAPPEIPGQCGKPGPYSYLNYSKGISVSRCIRQYRHEGFHLSDQNGRITCWTDPVMEGSLPAFYGHPEHIRAYSELTK